MLSLKNKIVMSAAAIGLLSTGGLVTASHAQNSQMPPQGQQQQQMNVTDAQLQEFVKAEASVRQVQSQFQAQAQGIETQAEATALQQQVNQQMVKAIQQTDLSIQEYNQIASLVQANPQVQQRYMELAQ